MCILKSVASILSLLLVYNNFDGINEQILLFLHIFIVSKRL